MATAHGAGLMLVPALIPLRAGLPILGEASRWLSLMAVGVHALATLAATGLVAILVYDWLGIALLRKGWINLVRYGPAHWRRPASDLSSRYNSYGCDQRQNQSRAGLVTVRIDRRRSRDWAHSELIRRDALQPFASMSSRLISTAAIRIGSRIWYYSRISALQPLHLPIDNV
jgi:hypothetical protein